MAPESQGPYNGTASSYARNGQSQAGPPPSTLAAELVENISATAKLSRTDETAELKRLSAVIEKVKNQPGLLTTTEDRVEHNNMLIYVYTRVVLESLRWDDSSADPLHLRAEALKALEFLRVTIKETPEVLMYRTNGSSLLFRGTEPLWAWLLPRILKPLAQEQCGSIFTELEGFCEFLLRTALHKSSLHDVVRSLLCYFQANIDDVLLHVEKPVASAAAVQPALTLPPKSVLKGFSEHAFAFGLTRDPSENSTFRLVEKSEALRYAFAGLKVVVRTLLDEKDAEVSAELLTRNATWLLDYCLRLRLLLPRGGNILQLRPIDLLPLTLKLVNAMGEATGVAAALRAKGSVATVLIIASAAKSMAEVTSEITAESKAALSTAVLEVAKLCSQSDNISQLARSELLAHLMKLASQCGANVASADLVRSVQLLEHVTQSPNLEILPAHLVPARFDDGRLGRKVDAIVPRLAQEPEQHSRKRRRITDDPTTIPELPPRLCNLLRIPASDNPRSVGRVFLGQFARLTDAQRCEAIDLLTSLSCPAMEVSPTVSTSLDPSAVAGCPRCLALPSSTQLRSAELDEIRLMVASTLRELVSMPGFSELKKPRIVAMLALRRVILHSSHGDVVNLESSALGKWCLQSMQSKVRELRVAAGRVLPLFVCKAYWSGDVEPATMEHNRATVITFLKVLSDKDSPPLNETCIMAWAQLGHVLDLGDLDVVLLKLLDYLGHRNIITSAFAFNEILNLAEYHGQTPRRLFEPCWKTLALSAIKDLVSRPQTSMRLADLLQISVNELLLMLQRFALPWLILNKRREIVAKIADARRESEPWMVCLDSDNLPSVLALLLSQDVPDVESHVMSLFRFVSPYFDGLMLTDLLQPETFMTALELLKASGEADEAQTGRIRRALAIMANTLLDTKSRKIKKGQALAVFLQQHALGLATRFSEIINDSIMLRPPMQERRQCIRALEEMIKLGKSFIRIARPQISACLLSALADDDLRAPAFSCWSALLRYMDAEDVAALLEATFFVTGHYWQAFDKETKAQAKEILDYLLAEHSEIIKDAIDRLPLLPDAVEFRDASKHLNALRRKLDIHSSFATFGQRLNHENSGVVQQALRELIDYLRDHQAYLQASAISDQPDSVVLDLTRALLDCSAKYNGVQTDISRLTTECLGLIGCIDSNRLETRREEKQFVVVNNFADVEETTDFVLFMLENILVSAFLSTTDTHLQGYLSYVMQELLERCEFRDAYPLQGRDGASRYRKWLSLPEQTREILTPFLTSRYVLASMAQQDVDYPIYRPGKLYGNWLRTFVLDLLHKGQNGFAQLLFEPLCRVIRVKDLSIAEFLLPYVVVHVITATTCSEGDCDQIVLELKTVLGHDPPASATYAEREDRKHCCEAVFRVLDYCSLWRSRKQAQTPTVPPEESRAFALDRMAHLFELIPPDLIAKRSIDCKQYARALQHLEPWIEHMSLDDLAPAQRVWVNDTLLDLYANIDDPDGIEGLSAKTPLQLPLQILGHKKAGRWTEAQTWYEVQLAADPENLGVQLELLTCLKESGQHDVLLNYVEGMKGSQSAVNRIVPFAVEASWATGRWSTLQKYLGAYTGGEVSDVFNLGVASALLCLHGSDDVGFRSQINLLREKIGATLSYSTTTSLQASHEARLHCHVLSELELIAGAPERPDEESNHHDLMIALERRLEVIGAFVGDKQYLLGIRRAAMEAMQPKFAKEDISSLWLSSARLARKADAMHQSFNAVLHATKLGGGQAKIENGKLLWKQGSHRKAIQILQSAITTNSFVDRSMSNGPPTSSRNADFQRNLLSARAQLLLAKWQDSAGQSNASTLREKYQQVAKTHGSWEKGHYYLGRHYKKVLESEKSLRPDDQSDEYVSGETAKLVVENYLRSLNFGTKYLYQTLPRILTLWLELGAQVDKAPEGKVSLSRELHHRRQAVLADLHKQLSKNMQRMPAYIFYTALPQLVARIAHPNTTVFKYLEQIIIKVVEAHPRQALWSLFACMTTRQVGERRNRGIQMLQTLRGGSRKVEAGSYDLKQLLRMGEKLAEQLLLACNNGDFQSNRTTMASITRDLNFNHKCTPCPLVVPIESCLTATLPTLTDNVKRHKAFSRDVITVDSFLDEVLVLGSLAKPRKLTARGSDGKNYGLLLKPKDDMRTDQRLMEFNSLINRSLKRDAEASRRQLYIRTYAVTPLNEECGIIEWVEGLKTLRDILLNIYKGMGIAPNYGQIAELMKQACTSDDNVTLFTKNVRGMFPRVLGKWFLDQFPHPSAWLAARTRYTRSCAVMSMVGTILGLGDRHGENVLLEEGNGGVFHVDFNCLFDKGLTFAQPERVPFRLTHNMVGAMGLYGYEGPFRTCSELTLRILRQQEETLMTILEAFIYDPTLDLQRDKRRKGDLVRLDPTSVVASIKRKVRGLMGDESIPLGVEGQVEELIKQAVDPRNLSAMYIGWCPFL